MILEFLYFVVTAFNTIQQIVYQWKKKMNFLTYDHHKFNGFVICDYTIWTITNSTQIKIATGKSLYWKTIVSVGLEYAWEWMQKSLWFTCSWKCFMARQLRILTCISFGNGKFLDRNPVFCDENNVSMGRHLDRDTDRFININ